MRRSRSPLTAWPAFADIMTTLAVVGLGIAIVVSVRLNGGATRLEKEHSIRKDSVEALEREVDSLKAELNDAQKKLNSKDSTLEVDNQRKTFGHFLCLGTRPERPRSTVSLLHIEVTSTDDASSEESSLRFKLSERWPARFDSSIKDIPNLDEAISIGPMPVSSFRRYADRISAYGKRGDTFGNPCWFYIVVRNKAPFPVSATARGIVEEYFGFSNPDEAMSMNRSSR